MKQSQIQIFNFPDITHEIFSQKDILYCILNFCTIDILFELRKVNNIFYKTLPFEDFYLDTIKLSLFFKAGYKIEDLLNFDRKKMLQRIFNKNSLKNLVYLDRFYEKYQIHCKFTNIINLDGSTRQKIFDIYFNESLYVEILKYLDFDLHCRITKRKIKN